MKPSKSSDKKRVIVDYKNVTPDILEMFTDLYPYGYEDDIIKFKNAKGEMVTAVPVETDDTKYLIKVGVEMDAKIEAFLDDEDDDESEDDMVSEDSGMEAPSDEDED
ncbi:MAG TPA: hypothetical protein DCG19_01905 [Cryomorphaceae bacterium]|nr:hypothetical protein [Owenweeksia sp.]MBF98510.1 hypothetical protein [Owenweeksia sp.]HAD96125.1 hypothetical protein [Cryomorphaceae bacterium]HBF18480.1 hypothetical protein [Cryomorphaceae bacterium]HCQ15351.1 hypothetical protein [Cryomorphaceae bacterium]|tara:strand:+ start:1640 stop:1960 length:321 start_codon:yes stop_codon:yes gene_type:complete